MTPDRVAWPDRENVGVIVGCALVDGAMWPMFVVLLDVLDEPRSELAFACGNRSGIRMAVTPEPPNTSSNDLVNCPAPSRIRYRSPWTPRKAIRKFRAAWVVQDPVRSRAGSIHVGPVRSRVGSIPADLRIFHTVDAATRCPRRASCRGRAGGPSSDSPPRAGWSAVGSRGRLVGGPVSRLVIGSSVGR